MFLDRNDVLQRTSSRRGPGFSLWTIRSSSDAYEAARAGWIAAGWLCFGYSFGAFAIVSRMLNVAIGSPLGVIIGVYAAFAVLGAVLAGFIFFRQARWASVVLTVWAALEVLLKLLAFFYAGMFILPSMVVNVVVLVLAVRSARGAFRLAEFRRHDLSPKVLEETFR